MRLLVELFAVPWLGAWAAVLLAQALSAGMGRATQLPPIAERAIFIAACAVTGAALSGYTVFLSRAANLVPSMFVWVLPAVLFLWEALIWYSSASPEYTPPSLSDTMLGPNCQGSECLYLPFVGAPLIIGMTYSLVALTQWLRQRFSSRSISP